MEKIRLNYNISSIKESEDYYSRFIENKSHFNDNIEIDISSLNIIDSCTTAFLLSTFVYTKKPSLKIRWQLKDYETFKLISLRKLKNMELGVKNNIKCLILDSEKRIWQAN